MTARTGVNKKHYELHPFTPGSRPSPPEGLGFHTSRPVRLQREHEPLEGYDPQNEMRHHHFEQGLKNRMDLAEQVKQNMIRKERRRKENKAGFGGLFPAAVKYAVDNLHEPAPEKKEFTFKRAFKKEGHVHWGYMTAARMEVPPRPDRVGLTKDSLTGGKLAQLRCGRYISHSRIKIMRRLPCCNPVSLCICPAGELTLLKTQ